MRDEENTVFFNDNLRSKKPEEKKKTINKNTLYSEYD